MLWIFRVRGSVKRFGFGVLGVRKEKFGCWGFVKRSSCVGVRKEKFGRWRSQQMS